LRVRHRSRSRLRGQGCRGPCAERGRGGNGGPLHHRVTRARRQGAPGSSWRGAARPVARPSRRHS
jgi:hypothetical protein